MLDLEISANKLLLTASAKVRCCREYGRIISPYTAVTDWNCSICASIAHFRTGGWWKESKKKSKKRSRFPQSETVVESEVYQCRGPHFIKHSSRPFLHFFALWSR